MRAAEVIVLGRVLSWRACVSSSARTFVLLIFALLAFAGVRTVAGQRIAVLTPDNVEDSVRVGSELSDALTRSVKIVDPAIAESAYRSVSPATPFNLTSEESRRIGIAIGCDYFVVLRTASQRRSPLGRADYFETYAPIYVHSSRTGRMIFWKLQRTESAAAAASRKMFDDAIAGLAEEIVAVVKGNLPTEINAISPPDFEEPPEENSPAARGFRAPVPFRRLKPEYTPQAAFYDVKATVDVTIYLSADSKVIRTDLERAAGFGLDESVIQNIRSMNWRPAERNGKPMAMKFLVRYNFKKPE